MTERVLKAFWHRGRRMAVAWTTAELERRTGLCFERLNVELRTLSRKGWATGHKANHRYDRATWELTPAGKAEAEQIIRAEAIARSA